MHFDLAKKLGDKKAGMTKAEYTDTLKRFQTYGVMWPSACKERMLHKHVDDLLAAGLEHGKSMEEFMKALYLWAMDAEDGASAEAPASQLPQDDPFDATRPRSRHCDMSDEDKAQAMFGRFMAWLINMVEAGETRAAVFPDLISKAGEIIDNNMVDVEKKVFDDATDNFMAATRAMRQLLDISMLTFLADLEAVMRSVGRSVRRPARASRPGTSSHLWRSQ